MLLLCQDCMIAEPRFWNPPDLICLREEVPLFAADGGAAAEGKGT